MAAVTVEELVRKVGIAGTKLNENCSQDHLASVSTSVGFDWRLAAPHLGLSGSDIDDIDQEGKKEQEKRRKTLEKWIGKYAFKATYRMLVEALLKISRADLAEKACRLLVSKSGESSLQVQQEKTPPHNIPESGTNSECPIPESLPTTTESSSAPNVEDEIRKMERLFFDLVSKAALVMENSVDLLSLKYCITQLPMSLKHQHMKFVSGKLSDIRKAETTFEIFFILGENWNFLNCGLLELIVERFGDQGIKEQMERYLERLRSFRCQTKVRDFVGNWAHSLPRYSSVLKMEMTEEWLDRTLEDVDQLRREVSRHLTFENYTLTFEKVETGSVILVWALHCSFPLSSLVSQSVKELHKCGVLRIEFKGTCIFNQETQKLKELSDDEEEVKETFPVELQIFEKEGCQEELLIVQSSPQPKESSPVLELPAEVQPEQLPKNGEQVLGETTKMALDYLPKKMEKGPYEQLHALQDEINELTTALEIREAQHALQKEEIKEASAALKQKNAHLEYERSEKEYLQQKVKQLDQHLQDVLTEKEEIQKQKETQLEHERNEKEQFQQTVKQQQQQINELSAALEVREAQLEHERNENEQFQQRVKQQQQLRGLQEEEIKEASAALKQKKAQLEHERSEKQQQQQQINELSAALEVREAQLEHERSEKEQQQQQINELSAALEVREAQLEHERSKKEHLQQKVNQLQQLHALQEEEIKKVSTVQKQKEAQLENEREYLQQRIKQLDRQLQDVLTEKKAAKEERGDRARELEKQPHAELEQFNREEDPSTAPLAPSELELALPRHNIKPQYEFIEDATSPQTRIKCITNYTIRGQPRRVESDGYYPSRLQAKENALKKILEAESKAVVPRGTAVTGVKRNKDILEEFSTKKWQKSPRYDTKACKGGYQTTVYVPEISMATGSVCKNKREAEDSAALAALKMLDGGDPGKLRQAGGTGDGTTSKDQPSPQGLPTDVQDTWASQELRHVTAPHTDLDEFIKKLSNIIGSNWPALARELGLTRSDIDGFREAHPHNLWEQIYQFFYTWKQQQGRDASIDKIVNGLRSAGLQQLVGDMEEWSRQEHRKRVMREKRLQKLDPSHPTVADSACSPGVHLKVNAPPIDASKNETASQQSPQGQFEVGDLIRVDQRESPWYGVIRWIGQPPGIQVLTAGVEMDDKVEGGCSGELKGVKYFDCPKDHGLFLPLRILKRDDRFGSKVSVNSRSCDETDKDAAKRTEASDVFRTPSQTTVRSHDLENTPSTASPGRPLRSQSTGGTPVGMVSPEIIEGHQSARTSLSSSFEMENILSALKEAESTPQTDSSVPGSDDGDPPLGQLVFYIPADRVGMVIGRDGKNIREVEALTGTIIKVDRTDRYSLRQNGTVKIFGKKDNYKKALLMILQNLENKLAVQLATTVTMTIPNRQMTGRVIGRGGANVEAIQKLSGAKVKIEDRKGMEALLEESRICNITGSAEQIEIAKKLIEQAMFGADIEQRATFAAIVIRLVKFFEEMGFEFPDVDF